MNSDFEESLESCPDETPTQTIDRLSNPSDTELSEELLDDDPVVQSIPHHHHLHHHHHHHHHMHLHDHHYVDHHSDHRLAHFYIDDEELTRQKLAQNFDDFDDSDSYECESKQVIVGICAMEKKTESRPMKEILTRLNEFEYIKTVVFTENTILTEPVDKWPLCDCLISFHSKGFPLSKAIEYVSLREPFIVNDLHMQYDLQDRRKVYRILEEAGIELPRYVVLDRDSPIPEERELVEHEDHIEINGVVFNKPFVEKPISAEDHNIYIYYQSSAGGGSQRLFRKIGCRSSVYSPESHIRKTGSYIYEEFMPTDGTDVKVYTVGPDYAHAEARKSPALDGKVERDKEGKEIRYPVILSNAEKLNARKVCLAFNQMVCGFDLLRANGKSYVCDVNGFSFVKNSMKYYDDSAKILGNMILRNLAPQLHIPWHIPFQLDDPPIVPTTVGKMMELRCAIAVIRHGDRTPKQKMKMEVKHQKFFEIFEKYGGYKDSKYHVKLKKPKQLQEILDIARYLLLEIDQNSDPEIEENKSKLEQLKSVLEMYGHFSGINRKVQLKYQPKGRPRQSSSEEDNPRDPSLLCIVKWGGELTAGGRIQAEELGRVFRCMYPGGQGEYAGTQGLGLLRLHSTFRHDLKIYASDEGRVQMTAAAFAKGLLALEGELTPILVQMVKSANTNGLLDNDCESSKLQNAVKRRLHDMMQMDRDFTKEDIETLNQLNARSLQYALNYVKNPVKACDKIHNYIQELNILIKTRREDSRDDYHLYYGETWDLMQRRWSKLEKDFKLKNGSYDISKIPDIYDCIKYDLQHNQHVLQFPNAEEFYTYAKALADIVIPQEYGITQNEKLTIGLGICSPLLKKIRSDLLTNTFANEDDETESVNRLNPHYSHGVSSPGRHVRTRLYFTSESHIHSLLNVLRLGGLFDEAKDEQWRRAMDYVSLVSELNYMTQIVIMLYEDQTKDPTSDDRFHIELHFSPGVVCCLQKNHIKGPGFRPQSKSSGNTVKKLITSNSCDKNLCHTSYKPCIKEEESDDLLTYLTIEESINPCLCKIHKSFCVSTPPESPTILEEPELEEKTKSLTPHDNQQKSEPIPITITSNNSNGQLDSTPTESKARSFSLSSSSQRPRSLESDIKEKQKKQIDKESTHTLSWNDVSGDCDFPGCQIINKHHRHSIPGQLSSYFRLCNLADLSHFGSTSSLFSTAVISGSSSAPNLQETFLHTSAEGCSSIPTIRPLETLHNALSLRHLDSFFEKLTSSPLYRLPLSSPMRIPINSSAPGMPSHSMKSGLPISSPTSSCQSFGWSGPPSFVSSSGPSSPNSSQLDLLARFAKSGDSETTVLDNCWSGPPSPLDSKYYINNS
ncbi:inositol hexakisphosphate and diphosphoinositol-pentakisphosphate kinase 2-like, partial [Oppia nitens]|uniref:inositol hexakisphosphate and diphosphoinositol-pentakisphosphate kinase 2-like n=1 Tax=Oppia nitens TaxID=1686743 RepID=UPI0023DA7423